MTHAELLDASDLLATYDHADLDAMSARDLHHLGTQLAAVATRLTDDDGRDNFTGAARRCFKYAARAAG